MENQDIFTNIKFQIKLNDFDDKVIAIATATINDQLDIRFIPIIWKEGKTGIFTTMPSLKKYRFQNCVVILDVDVYRKFQERVIDLFLEKAKEKFNKYEYEMIERAVESNRNREEEINLDDISL